MNGRAHRLGAGCWLVALAAGLLPAGCGTTDLRTTPLTASRRPFVPDVPVPMSFELVESLSRSYRTPQYRVIRHSYFGHAAPITVHAFYRNEMPKHGWQFLSDRSVDGNYQLFFRKGSEIADVRIQPDQQALRAGALVMVIVKPTSIPTDVDD